MVILAKQAFGKENVWTNNGTIYCKPKGEDVKKQMIATKLDINLIKGSDGIQGVRTVSREPVLEMSGQSANPFLFFFLQTLDLYEGTCCW